MPLTLGRQPPPKLRAVDLCCAEKAVEYSRVQIQRKKRRRRIWGVLSDQDAITSFRPHEVQVGQRFTLDDAQGYWAEHATDPCCLDWPCNAEPSLESIVSVYPNVKARNLAAYRSALQTSYVDMRFWGPIATIRCEPPQKALPRLLEVVMDDLALSSTPSHLLCVYQPRSVSVGRCWGEPRKMLIMPVHHVVLAAYCTRIRWPAAERHVAGVVGEQDIPAESLSPAITITATALGLRPVPVRVPDLATFEPLLHFMYHGNPLVLFKNFLPRLHAPPPGMIPDSANKYQKIRLWHEMFGHNEWIGSAAGALAMAHQPPEIRGFIRKIWWAHWNLTAMGVHDRSMKRVLNACWDIAQLAREMQASGGIVPPLTGQVVFREWIDVNPHDTRESLQRWRQVLNATRMQYATTMNDPRFPNAAAQGVPNGAVHVHGVPNAVPPGMANGVLHVVINGVVHRVVQRS